MKRLIEFSKEPSPYLVSARAEADSTQLTLRFKIEARDTEAFSRIPLPAPVLTKAGDLKQSLRKNELWKATCFECFIPLEGSSAYLEFNAAPSGHWNMYAFQDYRVGMTEFPLDSSTSPLQESFRITDTCIESEWIIPLTAIRLGFESVGGVTFDSNHLKMVGLSAVLTAPATTYWAFAHAGAKPDFHLRSSFVYPLSSAKIES